MRKTARPRNPIGANACETERESEVLTNTMDNRKTIKNLLQEVLRTLYLWTKLAQMKIFSAVRYIEVSLNNKRFNAANGIDDAKQVSNNKEPTLGETTDDKNESSPHEVLLRKNNFKMALLSEGIDANPKIIKMLLGNSRQGSV